MSDTPEAAAREVAERIVKKVRTTVLFVELEPSAYVEQITAALLSFRRAALEEAACMADEQAVISATLRDDCEIGTRDRGYHDGQFVAFAAMSAAIRALAGSTKEGE